MNVAALSVVLRAISLLGRYFGAVAPYRRRYSSSPQVWPWPRGMHVQPGLHQRLPRHTAPASAASSMDEYGCQPLDVLRCGIEKPGVGLSQERSSPKGGETRPGVLELRRRSRSNEADQAPPGAEQRLSTLKDVPVLGPPLGHLIIQLRSFVQLTSCLGKHRLGGEPSILM